MRFLIFLMIVSSLVSGCNASLLSPNTIVDNDRLVVIADGEQGQETIEDLSTEIGASKIEWLAKPNEGGKVIGVLYLPGTALMHYREINGSNDSIKVSLVKLYEQEPTRDEPIRPVSESYLDSINVKKSWDLGKGSGVLIGVADDGIDYTHPDLAQNVFVNSTENITPDDGLDNDKNGYIDDSRGWDFGRSDNDPKPEYCVLTAAIRDII